MHPEAPASARWDRRHAQSWRAMRTAHRWRPTCRASWAAPATKSTYAGLAVPRRIRILRRDMHRDGRGGERNRARLARSRGQQPLGPARTPRDDGRRRRARACRDRATSSSSCAFARRASRPNDCARWSKRAIAARPISNAVASASAGRTCASTSTPSRGEPDGRVVGNPACRSPRRRHLHRGEVHRALVLQLAQRGFGGTVSRARRRARRDLPPDHRGRVLRRDG